MTIKPKWTGKSAGEYEQSLKPNAPIVTNPYRNQVIEEVAEHIEKFHPAFGQDTVYSFAAFVRGMKQ